MLKYAYPRDVEENPDYHSSVTTHFLSNPPKEKIISPRMIQRSHSESELISSPGNHSQSSADSSDAGTEDGTSVHSLSVRFHSSLISSQLVLVKCLVPLSFSVGIQGWIFGENGW